MTQLADLNMDLAGSGSNALLVKLPSSVRGERYLCSDHVVEMEGLMLKIWRTHSTAPFVDDDWTVIYLYSVLVLECCCSLFHTEFPSVPQSDGVSEGKDQGVSWERESGWCGAGCQQCHT
jgi:hypothetical protein